MNIRLELCKRTDPQYQTIRDRHYVSNRGVIGQQKHYLVYHDDVLAGIISGASAVWAVKSRDLFFGITKENRVVSLPSIINNVVFRLEDHTPNLATAVLALWRRRVALDWLSSYNVVVHGFETFVVEEDYRKGTLYRADNWDYIGLTSGNTKSHALGIENRGERKETEPKLVYAKKIPRTSLSTHYTSTWRRQKTLTPSTMCGKLPQ